MIFLAAGTHHQPFDRLVLAAELLAVTLDEEVVLQRGSSRLAAPHARVFDVMPPPVFEEHLQRARVVVLHAGSSSFLQARALGRRPLLVPRRPEHGEHIDDHQVRFACSVPPEEAAVVEPPELLSAIAAHDEGRLAEGAVPSGDDRSLAFCARFGPLVEALVTRK